MSTKHDIRTDPYDGFFRDVDVETIERVVADLVSLTQDPRYIGDEGALQTLRGLAVWGADLAQRRREAEDGLRIELEANGHEVGVLFDGVAADQQGRGWWAWCWCSRTMLDPGFVVTREEAIEIAAAHAADSGGQWRAGEPWDLTEEDDQ